MKTERKFCFPLVFESEIRQLFHFITNIKENDHWSSITHVGIKQKNHLFKSSLMALSLSLFLAAKLVVKGYNTGGTQ